MSVSYEDIERLHEETKTAYEEAEQKAAELQGAVTKGLAQGLSATTIANRLGVVRARVYQYKRQGDKRLKQTSQ